MKKKGLVFFHTRFQKKEMLSVVLKMVLWYKNFNLQKASTQLFFKKKEKLKRKSKQPFVCPFFLKITRNCSCKYEFLTFIYHFFGIPTFYSTLKNQISKSIRDLQFSKVKVSDKSSSSSYFRGFSRFCVINLALLFKGQEKCFMRKKYDLFLVFTYYMPKACSRVISLHTQRPS